MAKAKNRAEYVQQWKNHVAEILYGPVLDINVRSDEGSDLDKRMRDTVTDLCRQIDEVGEVLVEEGTFSE